MLYAFYIFSINGGKGPLKKYVRSEKGVGGRPKAYESVHGEGGGAFT